MAVGTQATVKCVLPGQVAETGAQVVLANTYHMGTPERVQLVERHGGLHQMMRWDRTILTDSGGFQVFSLPGREIDEEGVQFVFQQGGEPTLLTPERSMEIQRGSGAIIVMAFDECVEYPASHSYVKASVDRTTRWLERCTSVQLGEHQHLFGIVQGGVELDLKNALGTGLSLLLISLVLQLVGSRLVRVGSSEACGWSHRAITAQGSSALPHGCGLARRPGCVGRARHGHV